MLNRSIAPEIRNAVDFHFDLKPVDRYTLHNGVEVYSLNAGEEEVVQLEWVFFAGNSWEEKNLVAASTNFLLKNGTTRHSALEINEHFEFFGSYLNRNCYNETSAITLHALTKHLHELLPMVAELLSESNMPQHELDIFVQNSKQKLSVSLKKCDFVANRLIDAMLYGDAHPYGRYSRAEDFDALTREDLQAFYDQHYKQGRCVMFVAGRLPANLQELLNETIGQLPLKPALITPVSSGPLPGETLPNRQQFVLNDPQGVQGAIRMASHFPNRHHPHFQEVQVLNTLFGGFFGSRLMSNIREEKGYTYGIHSYIQNHMGPCAWMVSTEAGRDVCEATVKEVYSEMELLRQEPVDDEELLLVRNYMLGSLLGDLDGPFQIINRWKSYVLNATGPEYFFRGIDTIRSISPQRLQELANIYLVPDKFYELTVV